MNEIELHKLYDVVSKEFDIGDFESFKTHMSTTDDRKKFYDMVMDEGFDLGDYGNFEKRLSGENESPKQDQNKPNLGGVGSSADIKNIKSYPKCVQSFGKPVNSGSGQWYIVGTGEHKGKYFYNNGRYFDESDNQTKNYGCKDQMNGINPVSVIVFDKASSGGSTTPPKSRLMHYTPCTNLPCQFGTKNPKIREIQTCLGFPLKWQTGNFGPITRKGLKDLQYDLSKGITDEIYGKIKANCGSANSSKPDHPPLSPSGNNPATDNVEPAFKDQDQLGVGRQ
jgi:hypothetical protein